MIFNADLLTCLVVHAHVKVSKQRKFRVTSQATKVDIQRRKKLKMQPHWLTYCYKGAPCILFLEDNGCARTKKFDILVGYHTTAGTFLFLFFFFPISNGCSWFRNCGGRCRVGKTLFKWNNEYPQYPRGTKNYANFLVKEHRQIWKMTILHAYNKCYIVF